MNFQCNYTLYSVCFCTCSSSNNTPTSFLNENVISLFSYANVIFKIANTYVYGYLRVVETQEQKTVRLDAKLLLLKYAWGFYYYTYTFFVLKLFFLHLLVYLHLCKTRIIDLLLTKNC